MAKRRLNDVAALAERPPGGEASHSMSTRKIDNGWLVESSVCDPKTGAYKSSCTFSPNPPRIIPGRVARTGVSPDSGDSLRRTMDYLKNI